MSYIITTFCYGPKYQPIKDDWINQIKQKNPNATIQIFENVNILEKTQFIPNYPGYIWAIRYKHNLDLLMKQNTPIVMCDLDVIIEKNIQPIVELPYDIIVSKEIGGSIAYPKECSEKIGFGICCGFMILKSSSRNFVMEVFRNMYARKYETYDDQVNIMHYIVNHARLNIREEKIILDEKEYTNKIIEIDNIKICVLDFNIVTRDPIYNNGQFANHINVDNIGGTNNFIRYFYEDLEKLPLTCRCGKFGDTNICSHIRNQL